MAAKTAHLRFDDVAVVSILTLVHSCTDAGCEDAFQLNSHCYKVQKTRQSLGIQQSTDVALTTAVWLSSMIISSFANTFPALCCQARRGLD